MARPMKALCGVVIWILIAAISVVSGQTPPSGPVIYSYDELGRLVAVIDGAGNAASYTYDAVGNILSIQRFTASQISVLSFTPERGAEGTPVTITGTGFSSTPSANLVLFNGTAAVVSAATTNQIIASVPVGATSGPISVTTPNGTSASTKIFKISPASLLPTIIGISPNVASIGAPVSITGTNFDAIPSNNRLRFNNIAPGTANSATSTTINSIIPSGTGSGRLTLATPAGLAVSSVDLFVPFSFYIASQVGFTGRTVIGSPIAVALDASKIGIVVFDAAAGQRLSLVLTNSSCSGGTAFILGPDGSILTSSGFTTSDLALSPIPISRTGTYSVGIAGPTSACSVNMLISDSSDVTANISIDGPPVTVTTTIPGQSATLKFQAHAEQQFVLQVTNVTNPSAVVNLTGATGEPLVSLSLNNTPGQVFSLDQQTLPVTGTYSLRVVPSGNTVGSETFQLFGAQDFVSAITIGGPPVRVPSTGDTVVGQNGKLTFTGAVGQKVSGTISGATYPAGGCILGVKDLTGAFLTNGLVCASGGDKFIDTFSLNGAGPFTVFVDPQQRSTGNVTIALNDASDVTGTISTDGSPATITTTVPGQDARLSFSGTAGQLVSLQISNITNPAANVTLLQPDGGQVSLGSIQTSTPGQVTFIDPQTLPVSGSYAIWIRHVGANVGSETFQVTSTPDVTGAITIDGSPITLTTTLKGQDARLSFSGTAGQKIYIQATGVTNPSATIILLKPDGSQQAAVSVSSGAGQSFVIDTQLLATTGTYTLWVRHNGAYVGSETLQITSAPDVNAAVSVDGAPVTVATSLKGQDAKLSFSAVAGQRIVLQVTAATNPSATVALMRTDGTQQTLINISNIPSNQIWFMDTQTLATTGTYTLWVQHSGSNTGTETFQLNSVPADFVAPITVGGSVRVPASGNTVLGQNAVLTFAGSAGQKVSVSTSAGTYASCSLSLKDPTGSVLASVSCGAPSGFINSVTLAANGNYSILVDPQGMSTGSVTVTLNNDSDVTGTINVDGVPTTVNTTVPGQDARITFAGTAGQRVVLQITNVTNTGASAVLLKPDGSQQTSIGISNSPLGQIWFVDTQTLSSTGTYTWWIQHSGSNTGAQTLQLNSVPADFTATAVIDGPPLRVPTTGSNAIGQNAILSFTATAGQKFTINISNSTYSPYLQCIFTIKDPNGATVTSSYCGSGGPSSIFATASIAGTYTIFVDPQGPIVGSTTFALVSNSDVTGTIAIDGPAVTSTTTIAGQDARLTFTGSAGQRVVVRVTGVTNPAGTLNLVKPDNTYQASVGFNNAPGQTWFMDTQVLATSGTYTLWIQHSGTSVGSETLQLSSVPVDFTSTITPGGTPVRVPAVGDTAIGQNGILSFNGLAGQKVSITVSGGTYSPYTNCTVSLRNPALTTLGSGYCGNGAPAYIDAITLPASGAYTLLVDPQGIATGNTTVQLNDSSDITGPIPADGTAVQATTGLGQDIRYSFGASAGQRVALTITNVTNPFATVFLLRPDGTSQTNFNIGSSPAGQLFFMDTQTLVAAGTYTIWIRHSGAGFGSETLKLNNVAPDYQTALTLGTTLQVPTTGALTIGQAAKLSFTGNAGFQLNAQFTNNTIGPVTASLLKADGTTLTSISSSAASFGLPTVMLPADGPYIILIDPTGAATGTIAVLVTQVGGPRPLPSRAATSAINPGNPLSTNLVGLFLMNEGTGTTDVNLVDGQVATFASGGTPATPPVWNTADPSVVLKGTATSLSSYLDAGADLNFDQLPTNKMTVVAKVFLNSVGAGGIAEKTDDSIAGFTFGLDSSGALNLYVLKNSGGPMRVTTGAGALSSGQWAQVAFTWDGTVGTAAAAHIYINGVEQTKAATQDGGGPISYASATAKSLRIGNNSYTTTVGSLNGKMAYLAVYRGRVLNNTELNQLDTQLPIR